MANKHQRLEVICQAACLMPSTDIEFTDVVSTDVVHTSRSYVDVTHVGYTCRSHMEVVHVFHTCISYTPTMLVIHGHIITYVQYPLIDKVHN